MMVIVPPGYRSFIVVEDFEVDDADELADYLNKNTSRDKIIFELENISRGEYVYGKSGLQGTHRPDRYRLICVKVEKIKEGEDGYLDMRPTKGEFESLSDEGDEDFTTEEVPSKDTVTKEPPPIVDEDVNGEDESRGGADAGMG